MSSTSSSSYALGLSLTIPTSRLLVAPVLSTVANPYFVVRVVAVYCLGHVKNYDLKSKYLLMKCFSVLLQLFHELVDHLLRPIIDRRMHLLTHEVCQFLLVRQSVDLIYSGGDTALNVRHHGLQLLRLPHCLYTDTRSRNRVQGGPENVSHNFSQLHQTLADFQNSFTGTLSSTSSGVATGGLGWSPPYLGHGGSWSIPRDSLELGVG